MTALGSARLYLDSRLLIEIAQDEAGTAAGAPAFGRAASAVQVASTAVTLAAGAAHDVVVEYAAPPVVVLGCYDERLADRTRRV